MIMAKKIFLYLWFYVGWFGCLYTAQIKLPLLSLVFPAILLVFSWFNKLFTKKQWSYLALFVLVGVGFEYVVFKSQLISFSDNHFQFIPIWLISLWVLFVLTLPLMSDFFGHRLVLAAIFGAVFGPLSYYNGASFGIIEIKETIGYAAYSVFWAIYFVTTMYLLRKKI